MIDKDQEKEKEREIKHLKSEVETLKKVLEDAKEREEWHLHV